MKPAPPRNVSFLIADEVNVYDLVVPAAIRGLSDPDPAVRRACVNAIRQVTLSLRDMVPNVELPPEYINLRTRPPFPPAGRPWTARERARVEDARKEVRDLNQDLGRVLPEFRKNALALTRATGDADPEVRIRARQVLEDLAAVRRLLTNLDNFLPADPARPLGPPAEEKKEKTATRPGVTLGAPLKAAPATLARPVAVSAPAAGLVLVRHEAAIPVPAPAGKAADPKPNDALGQAVDEARLALIREGLRDPDPKGRLAAVNALELFGAQAEPAIPMLAVALGDPNKFVRWASARALGRMGLGEREALPGLVRLLCDPDLDVRVAAIDALRRYGPKVPAAVPALTATLGRGDTEARIAVLEALSAIGPAAAPSLPAVARALLNPDPRLRGEAARTLGTFGRAAAPFIPNLRKAMEDPDSDVRKAASEAILRITLGQ
jgi:HEAT repeat protein